MSLSVYLEVNGEEVFYANITHNLTEMAGAAGLYRCLWRPDEHYLTKAYQLIQLLTDGLVKLVADKAVYEQYAPDNGWGTYDGLVKFCTDYLAACKEYPEADVSVCR